MSELQLRRATEALGPLADELVFVGGASIYLLLTEAGTPPVRATVDVDVVAEVHSRGEYYALGERLRERGLVEAVDSEVVCRWRHPSSGLVLDVMPVAEEALGFANRWYEPGLEAPLEFVLEGGATVRVPRAPLLLAMKLEAWLGRGKGDLLRSLDAYDVLVLVNGRPELVEEIADESRELRAFVAAELRRLVEHEYFDYLLEDAVAGYRDAASDRARLLRERVSAITGIA